MNRLMTSIGTGRSSRGHYTTAGYNTRQDRAQPREEDDLYIAKVPAGSAQDILRDLNREGYRCERPWRQASQLPLEEEPKAKQGRSPKTSRPRAPEKKRQRDLFENLMYEAGRDKAACALCVVLLVVLALFTSVYLRQLYTGVQIENANRSKQAQINVLIAENDQYMQQLEMAKSGERIRNLAQNELGMLRRERANIVEIYIQKPEVVTQETVQESEGILVKCLDFMLGMLELLHIGE